MSGFEMFPVSTDEAMACVARELAMRRNVYARQIDVGRMKPEAAAREIALMEGVLQQIADGCWLRSALEKIAAGDGVYGAQGLEYKNIARVALGRGPLG